MQIVVLPSWDVSNSSERRSIDNVSVGSFFHFVLVVERTECDICARTGGTVHQSKSKWGSAVRAMLLSLAPRLALVVVIQTEMDHTSEQVLNIIFQKVFLATAWEP